MKSILKVALMGAIVLTSCTEDEVVNQSNNLAIGFDTYVAKQTKAKPTTGTVFADGATFGVYAYNTKEANWSGTGIDNIATKPLINEEIKKATGKWTYGNTAYYVKNENISFLAYAPHIPNAQFSDGKLEYQVSTVLGEQKDLMVAAPVVDKKWDGLVATKMEAITFTFKHALSQVKFKAKLAGENPLYDIKVTSVTLKAIKSSGKVSLTESEINWGSDQAGSQNYIMDFKENKLAHDAAVDLIGTADDVFMLLPQTLKDVTFTFNITATAKTGGEVKARTFDVIVEDGTWAANNIYLYTATLTMDFDAPSIEFGEPTISEWSSDTGVDIDNAPVEP